MNTTLDTYYDRMASSLGDKLRVLEYIKGETVLDVGCGSGEMLRVLDSKGYNAFGIDPSAESLERAPKGATIKAYANEVHCNFVPEELDTVICSSVFHEVFSYGNAYGRVGQIQSLREALDSIYVTLKPGGRLIVRDGVSPGNSKERMWVDDNEAVMCFKAESPFSPSNPTAMRYTNRFPITLANRTVSLARRSHNIWEGSFSSLMEFAFTYTWGPDSWEREVQEYYGVYTLNGYSRFVESHGFKCIEKFGYVQQGYVNNLNGKVDFTTAKFFPDTNAIWVYEKI